MASPTPHRNIRPALQPTEIRTSDAISKTEIKSPPLEIPPGIEETRIKVLEIVAEFTGYPQEFIEMDADMEGELGIDSIKQAEIMAEIRSTFALPVDEEFQLRDHPTLAHILVYISSLNEVPTTQKSDSATQLALDEYVSNEDISMAANVVKSHSDEETLSKFFQSW